MEAESRISRKTGLLSLSNELLIQVASHLDRARDIAALQSTCVRFASISRDDLIWKRLFVSHFIIDSENGVGVESSKAMGKPPASRAVGWDEDDEEEVNDLRKVPVLKALRNVLFPAPPVASALEDVTDRTIERPVEGIPPRFFRSALLRRAVGRSSDSADLPRDVADEEELETAIRNQGLDWKLLYQTLFRLKSGNVDVAQLDSSDRTREPDAGAKGRVEPLLYTSTSVLGKRKVIDSSDDVSTSSPSFSRVAEPDSSDSPRRPQTLVQNSPHFIFVADRTPHPLERAAELVTVKVFSANPSGDSVSGRAESSKGDARRLRPLTTIDSTLIVQCVLQETNASLDTEVSISELRVDAGGVTTGPDSTSVQRLLVTYSSGHLAIFSVLFRDESQDVMTRLEVLREPSTEMTSNSEDQVVASAFNQEVLVTCSRSFRLMIYSLEEQTKEKTQHLSLTLRETMKSHICWWPAALSLRRIPVIPNASDARQDQDAKTLAYKLCVAYSTPSYPSSFTVGLQEMLIKTWWKDLDTVGKSRLFKVISSRHATAMPHYTRTPIDTRGSSIFRIRTPSTSREHSRGMPTWLNVLPGAFTRSGANRVQKETQASISNSGGTSSSRMLSITFDDPFIVVGSEDNLLEVFEVVGGIRVIGSSAFGYHGQPLRLAHRIAVGGHTSSVQSVALQDTRLISGGRDGSVMVWSLDGERGSESKRNNRKRRRLRSPWFGRDRRSDAASDAGRSALSHSVASTAASSRPYEMRHISTLIAPSPELLFSRDRDLTIGMAEADDDASSDSSDEAEANDMQPRRRGPTAITFNDREAAARHMSLPSLASMHLRSGATGPASRLMGTRRAVVSFVATSFDKVVSVFSSSDEQPAEEVVQVWSFVT